MHIEEILVKLNACLFKIKVEKLLEKYNEFWQKVGNIVKTEFDNNPVYNEIYIKTIIISYNRKINTTFHNNKKPKEGPEYICLSVMIQFIKKTRAIILKCF